MVVIPQYLTILLLLFSAVFYRREFLILFNRVAIIILLYSGTIACDSLYVSCLDTGIGIYNGLFHSTVITHSFDVFIYIIGVIILLLTAFYPRNLVEPRILCNQIEYKNRSFSKNYVEEYKNVIRGIHAPQFTMLESPLIILFILIGAILLMSSSDLVSMFLTIELQSYGLYILATLYRDSEWSTAAGLTYFLLGGLSSCFILLGSAMLYASCGLTSLDGIYVFYNIISAFGEPISTTYSFYAKPEIFNMGFLIMAVGYLFKVSAAPFHF
jgi:NADH-ubiquinone oxidoreductase chain 2